ncbi:MAG: VOC family protein [Myxococcales bacterium]|nr:VOC family protein [Myxococcales bacterium]
MSNVDAGRFVWFDLMSTDLAAAKLFYTAVTGWTLTPFGEEAGYDMWTAGETPIGGANPLPQAAIDVGAPPHWIGYVAVTDLDAILAKATELGGTVLGEPIAMDGVGRFAIVRDPQGAVLSAFQPAGDATAPDGDVPMGQFSWHELATTDWEAGRDFYAQLFGWIDSDSMEMEPGSIYQMYKAPGMTFALGGMYNKAPEVPMPSWLYYIKVPDLEASLATVSKLGGNVINGPMEVPGGSRAAQCMDPQGAMFALHGA